MKCLLWMIIFFISKVQTTSVDYKYQNLEQIPYDIPTDTVELNIGNNKLTQVGSQELANLTQLKIFRASANMISSISPNAFAGLPVAILAMSSNELLTFPNLQTIKGTLKTVSLSNNKISKINMEHTSGFNLLSNLHIGNNLISFIDKMSFKGTIIRYLRLYNNKLDKIPNLKYISGTLELLDLSDNPIPIIQRSDLDSLGILEVLDLGSTSLTSLPYLVDLLPAVTDLSLDGLVLECNCQAIWIKEHEANITGSWACTGEASDWSAVTLKMLEDVDQEICYGIRGEASA